MSALPKQVQAQAAEAERIANELAAANPPQVQPTPEEQPAQPESQQPAEAQQAQSTEEQAVPSESHPSSDENDVTWQRRYQTLRGMYDAEVPRMHGRIKELEQQLQQAVEQFKQAAQQPKQSEEPPKRLVTEKDEEAFGSDLLDVMQRKAQEVIHAEREQFTQMINELRAENAKLHQQVGSVSERQGATDRRGYLNALEQQIPGFEAINADPKFLEWLDDMDPMTGLSRKAYLTDAYNAMDVGRTAAIFTSWPGAKGHQQQRNPKADLAKQVAPNAARTSSTPPSNPNERSWSMREIDLFYKDLARGAYRGRDADAQRIEAEIDLAVSQGRVRE